MEPESSSSIKPGSSGRNIFRILMGLVLLVPASLCCLATLVLPTLQTATTSLTNASILGKSQFIGLQNYVKLFQDPMFAKATGFTLSLIVERLLMAILVPVLLALVVNEFRRAGRVSARLLLTVPLALFAPVPLALSWRIALSPQYGVLGKSLPLVSTEAAPRTLLFIDALSTLGLACGIGLAVYLMALRGAGDSAPTWKRVRKPLIVTWVIVGLAVIALSLQSFTLSYVLTHGGPASSTLTLMLAYFTQAFQMFKIGEGSAIAIIMLIVLALLGLATGTLIASTGLRLEMIPQNKPTGLLGKSGRPIAVILLALGILGSLGICALGMLPFVLTGQVALQGNASMSQMLKAFPIGQVMLNTIMPAVFTILLIQLPITYLAALGIGALRPLGRHSEWLLLLFSPWLFATIGPLSAIAFEWLHRVQLYSTWVGLIPPLALVNIPMLFILTLFFKGQQSKWQAAQAAGQSATEAFVRSMILPSLPLVVLLSAIALTISQQDLMWPLVVATKPDLMPLPLRLVFFGAQYATNQPALASALILFGIPSLVWSFLILGAFQIFYLDRLALGTPANDV